MNTKYFAIIDSKKYSVGYPQCAGCEHLCIPFPAECVYPGDGCEYPDELKTEYARLGMATVKLDKETGD